MKRYGKIELVVVEGERLRNIRHKATHLTSLESHVAQSRFRRRFRAKYFFPLSATSRNKVQQAATLANELQRATGKLERAETNRANLAQLGFCGMGRAGWLDPGKMKRGHLVRPWCG
ncbi:MAG TPA: hypothetical protein VFB72_11015 [Verrucomicrobiae bacterium]|nr:hypothetical protein [Verrucomicrobiae bacterium]